MNQKLIALDLDGTLLNNQSQVSPLTKKTIEQLKDQGHIVVIATGRAFRTSYLYYRELGLTAPIVNNNGSWCHNPTAHFPNTYHRGVNRDLALKMKRFESLSHVSLVSAELKNKVYLSRKHIPYPEFLPDKTGEVLHFNENNLIEDPTAVNIFSEELDVETHVQDEVQEIFGDQVSIQKWGGFAPCLEIVSSGLNKSVGLESILDHYKLQAKDIIAFGDEENDTQMLKFAGHGVKMKNGIKDLESVSDDMTDYTNSEDGVAKYLINYFGL